MRLKVRALIKSIGGPDLTINIIRDAICASDQFSIDPREDPYRTMVAQEARWWAYPKARKTKTGKAAVEAKQTASKKKELGAAAEEANAQQSMSKDENKAKPKKGELQLKQARFDVQCTYPGCKCVSSFVIVGC